MLWGDSGVLGEEPPPGLDGRVRLVVIEIAGQGGTHRAGGHHDVATLEHQVPERLRTERDLELVLALSEAWPSDAHDDLGPQGERDADSQVVGRYRHAVAHQGHLGQGDLDAVHHQPVDPDERGREQPVLDAELEAVVVGDEAAHRVEAAEQRR